MRVCIALLSLATIAACGSESATLPPPSVDLRCKPVVAQRIPGSPIFAPERASLTASAPVTLAVLGRGDFKPARTSAEVSVRGTTAYTTTWGNAAAAGSAFYIWDVAADVPRLVDSVRVDSATTLGDVQVTDDGTLLVVATERAPGSIIVYSLADPRKPVRLSRFSNSSTAPGVHTAEIGRVSGKLYGFLSIDR